MHFAHYPKQEEIMKIQRLVTLVNTLIVTVQIAALSEMLWGLFTQNRFSAANLIVAFGAMGIGHTFTLLTEKNSKAQKELENELALTNLHLALQYAHLKLTAKTASELSKKNYNLENGDLSNDELHRENINILISQLFTFEKILTSFEEKFSKNCLTIDKAVEGIEELGLKIWFAVDSENVPSMDTFFCLKDSEDINEQMEYFQDLDLTEEQEILISLSKGWSLKDEN